MDDTRAPFDPAHELQRCAELLVRRPSLALPTAIASALAMALVFATIVSAVVAAVAGRAAGGPAALLPSIGGGIAAALAGFALVAIGYAFATVLTLCGAPDVLLDRPIDWPADARVAFARFGQFVLLGLVGFALLAVLLPLCVVLVGIPLLLAVWYFFAYAPAAVAVGGESAFAAIGTSIRIARTRVPESLIAWIGIVAAFLAGAIANVLLGHIPLVNIVGSFLVGGLTAAYSELVRTRFYLALRIPGTVSTVTAAYAANPAPPSGPPVAP